MRHFVSFLTFVLLAAPAVAGEIRLEVKYRSAGTVYLAGGSADGLAVGDRLSVVTKGSTVGELEVVFLAEHSASCKVVSETRPVQAGDAAVIRKVDAPKVEAATPETSVSDVSSSASAARLASGLGGSTSSEALPWARARGSLSVGWSKLWDDTANAFDFEQRTARLDLGLWEIGGRPLQLNARARSRQDLRARPPGFGGIPSDERRDRLYELSARYDPRDGRFSFEAGRIGVSSLGLGYLDGATAELRAYRTLRLGGFFGNRADVERVTGFSSGHKYGGYLRLSAGGLYWPGNYDATAFVVRELAGSEVSREYVGVQSRISSKGFHFSEWAEVDLLRGWRESADGKKTQLSNLSLATSYRVTPSASLAVSYDQRRNYRTAETRSVPDILFDTFMHQGLRTSVDLARPGGISASGFFGVRLHDQQSATAYSYGGGVRHPNMLGTHLATSLDGSAFTNGTTTGYQGSARLGRTARSVMGDIGFGLSSYTLAGGAGARRQNEWLRLSARGDFGHGVWLYGELEYDKGDDVKGPRGAFELGYRF
jgi:hypothetical protein